PVENDTLDIWSLQKGTVSYGEAIYSIFFDTGIAEVREDQKSTINEIAELIKKYPQSKIRIEGNADIRAIATKEFPSNLELSQSRANSVKNALSQKITEVAGINFDGVVGFSDIKPKIYDAKTPEELQLNRRADVIIEKMKVETDKEVLNKINKFVYADSVDIYFDHDELILGETSKPKGLKSSSLDPYQNKVFTKAFGFPEYIIGALDVLKVALWTGLEKKEFELTVATSGEVFIPNVGDEKFYVAGKTPSQVEAELLETLRGVLRKPNVEVDVRFYNAHQSSILGEIRDTDEDETGPGRYALRGRTTLLDFISDHGGPTKEADLTKVQIIQENGQSLYYNLWRTIAEADVTQNPMMDADQIVFIPSVTTSSRFVFVFGEVNNPGLIEIKEQSGLPIIECIAKAGNFTQFSLKDEVRIIRGNVDKPDVITVDLDRLLTKGDFSQNIKVFDRDIVYISRTRYTTTTDFLLSLNPTLSLLQTMFLINQVVKN
ncbi:SLBB domain-containing protein, partial [bacterium]|nr:SLBB domain-containing protein [bacterium]